MREKLKEHAQGITAGATLILVTLFIKLLSSQASAEKPKEDATSASTPPFALCDASCDLMVPVTIDGKKLTFQVDTGAQITLVDISVFSLVPPNLGSCHIGGAFGGDAWCWLTKVDEIEVGGIKAKNVGVAVAPVHTWHPEADGVLGIDFLRNYKVTIDQNNLVLSKQGEK